MGYVKIVSVRTENNVLVLIFETDLRQDPEWAAATIQISVSKEEWVTWKASNAGKTFEDYLLERIKPIYNDIQVFVPMAQKLYMKEMKW